MKKTRYTGFVFLLCGVLFWTSCGAQKAAADRDFSTAELLKAGNYIFKAQRVTAQNGFTKYLTSDYDLDVSQDTLTARLPYFGRAYQAPMDPSKGGIDFTSTDFEYSIHENHKKGWEIKMTPRDQKEITDLILSVSSSGYATLRVNSLHKQPISFYGKIVNDY